MKRFARARRFRFLLWPGVILLIWLAVRKVPLHQVAGLLAGLELWQLLALVALNTAIILLLAGRWWLILNAQGQPLPFLSLLAYRLAGFGVTYLTPGPQMGGEPLQIHLLRSRHGVSTATSVAAVTLDKLLELQSNFAFLVLGLAVMLRAGLFGEQLNLLALLTMGGALALPGGYLLLLRLGRRPLSGLAARLARLFPARALFIKLQRGGESAEAQVSAFLRERPQALLSALLLSLLIWLTMLVEFWLTVRFLGFAVSLPAAVTLLTCARIAFLLPIPAGAGSLEAALMLGAEALGLPAALGLGISLLIRGRDLSLAALGLALGSTLLRSQAPSHPNPTRRSSLGTGLIELSEE